MAACLHDVYSDHLPGTEVLDLFAGTGQLGIEALSRGANQAVFVDERNEACNLVKDNLAKTKLEQQSTVICADYQSYLRHCNKKFDIIFLDPPFDTDFADKSLKYIAEENMLSDGGIIVYEHIADKVITIPEGLTVTDERKYGTIVVSYLEKNNG